MKRFMEVGACAWSDWGETLLRSGKWEGVFVEPHPESFSQLVERIIADKLIDDSNVKFVLAAVSDSHKISEFGGCRENFRWVSNCYSLREAVKYQSSYIMDRRGDFEFFVSTVKFDDLLAWYGEPIHELRMDIEGSEYSVLWSSEFPVRPFELIIEYHSDEYVSNRGKEDKINERLESFGYQRLGFEVDSWRYVRKDKLNEQHQYGNQGELPEQ